MNINPTVVDVFSGASCYVSDSWYSNLVSGSTWNSHSNSYMRNRSFFEY